MSPKVRRNLLIFIATISTSAIILFSKPIQQPLKITPPPEFSYNDIQGNSGTLQDARGRVILVHFWATWCPPCIKEFPELVELARTHPDNLTILAISVDQQEETVVNFIAKNLSGSPLPDNLVFVQDPKMTLATRTFQSVSFPETYIIGCDYMLREKVVGMEPDWPQRITPHLAACQPKEPLS